MMKNKEKIRLLEERISDLEVFRDYTTVKQIVKQHERSNEMISKKPELIEVPFKLDIFGEVKFNDEQGWFLRFHEYCTYNKIDQTQINRILIEMKEPKK